MDYTDIDTYITTEYRKFVTKQFLEHQQFNELLYYLDSQERYTRMTSIGSGILCGFQPKGAYLKNKYLKEVTLSQGLGLTSDGTLMFLSQLIDDITQDPEYPKVDFTIPEKTFTHYKVYDDYKVDPRYTPFYEQEANTLVSSVYGSRIEGASDDSEKAVEVSKIEGVPIGVDAFKVVEGEYSEMEFIIDENAPITFYELGTTEDAQKDSKFKPLTNINGNPELFVVLYNESYDKVDQPCIGVNCDQPASIHLQNTKVLLTDQGGIDALVQNDLAYQKYDLITFCNQLKTVNLKRPILNKSIVSLENLRDLYEGSTLDATLLNALEFNYEAIAQYFGMDTEITRAALETIVTPFFDDEVSFSFQYAYSFIKDLVDVYTEIKELLGKHIAVNDPTVSTFKNHLMLGSLKNPTDEYRHGFYAASVLDSEKIEDRIKFLISKSNQMLISFVPPSSKQVVTTEYEYDEYNYNEYDYNEYDYYGPKEPNIVKDIKVTESEYYGTLGEKAIPWYYEPVDVVPFEKNWSYKLYSQRQFAQNKSYQITNLTIAGGGLVRSKDLYAWDKKDLFRVEGIQGKDYETVKTQLEDIKELHQLSFSVIMLSLAELESGTDGDKDYFPDFIEKNPGLKHLGGVPEGGTLVLVCQSEVNPIVIADFGTPLSFCTPKIARILGIPVSELCENDDPIPLEISPIDGILTANVAEGLNGGIIGTAENGYQLDPSLVSKQLLGTELKFKINEKSVAATITVWPLPKITEIKLVSVFSSENYYVNGKQLVFQVFGTNISSYTFEWDFYNNGNYVRVQPDRNNQIIVDYEAFSAYESYVSYQSYQWYEMYESYQPTDNPNMVTFKVRITGANGCPLELEMKENLNTEPTVADNTLLVNFSTSFLPNQQQAFNEGTFINDFTDPDGDSYQTVRITELPTIGTLLFDGNPITVGFEFLVSDSARLKYSVNNVKQETDGLYVYSFDLDARIAQLVAEDYFFVSYANGVYTFNKLSETLIDTGVDGTFDSLSGGSGFNANVTGAGWFNGVNTTDSISPGSDGAASLSPPSPQGNTFAGGLTQSSPVRGNGSAPDFFRETMYTNIDVEAGKTYLISFWQSHGGADHSLVDQIVGSRAPWVAELDGVRGFSEPVTFEGFGKQTWSKGTILLTAPTTKKGAKLEMWAGQIEGTSLTDPERSNYTGYLSIDDIKVQEILSTSTDSQTLKGQKLPEKILSFKTSDDNTDKLFSEERDITIASNYGQKISKPIIGAV